MKIKEFTFPPSRTENPPIEIQGAEAKAAEELRHPRSLWGKKGKTFILYAEEHHCSIFENVRKQVKAENKKSSDHDHEQYDLSGDLSHGAYGGRNQFSRFCSTPPDKSGATTYYSWVYCPLNMHPKMCDLVRDSGLADPANVFVFLCTSPAEVEYVTRSLEVDTLISVRPKKDALATPIRDDAFFPMLLDVRAGIVACQIITPALNHLHHVSSSTLTVRRFDESDRDREEIRTRSRSPVSYGKREVCIVSWPVERVLKRRKTIDRLAEDANRLVVLTCQSEEDLQKVFRIWWPSVLTPCVPQIVRVDDPGGYTMISLVGLHAVSHPVPNLAPMGGLEKYYYVQPKGVGIDVRKFQQDMARLRDRIADQSGIPREYMPLKEDVIKKISPEAGWNLTVADAVKKLAIPQEALSPSPSEAIAQASVSYNKYRPELKMVMPKPEKSKEPDLDLAGSTRNLESDIPSGKVPGAEGPPGVTVTTKIWKKGEQMGAEQVDYGSRNALAESVSGTWLTSRLAGWDQYLVLTTLGPYDVQKLMKESPPTPSCEWSSFSLTEEWDLLRNKVAYLEHRHGKDSHHHLLFITAEKSNFTAQQGDLIRKARRAPHTTAVLCFGTVPTFNEALDRIPEQWRGVSHVYDVTCPGRFMRIDVHLLETQKEGPESSARIWGVDQGDPGGSYSATTEVHRTSCSEPNPAPRPRAEDDHERPSWGEDLYKFFSTPAEKYAVPGWRELELHEQVNPTMAKRFQDMGKAWREARHKELCAESLRIRLELQAITPPNMGEWWGHVADVGNEGKLTWAFMLKGPHKVSLRGNEAEGYCYADVPGYDLGGNGKDPVSAWSDLISRWREYAATIQGTWGK